VSAQRCSPVAVPGVRLAGGAAALHTDRGHSLRSLDSATGGAPIAPHRRPGDCVWCQRQCGVWIHLLDYHIILTKRLDLSVKPFYIDEAFQSFSDFAYSVKVIPVRFLNREEK